ncbi:glycoside hydrolase family 108 protein [Heminiphilus faecis]|jgi:lysozyme family protein|uniref:glycoside hydrolase family 108 protein n=1 Tax=Heminiphilus faecis TaxID=2601703 RepID=UPI001247BD13|nr:glycosyl hydrolase 108 family protein [Heminiphilus faecis]
MAKIDILAPFILSFEGGYVNDPHDPGGATNRGVTIATWRQVGYDKDGDGDIDVADLKLITPADAVNRVMKPHYWDRWQADRIKSQSVANLVVDWVWASGKYGITGVQKLLGVKEDGIVGEKTLAALNAQDPRALFDHIHRARARFIEDVIARRPTSAKYRAGWLRRLDYIRFGSLVYNTQPPKVVSFNDLQP